MANGETAIPIRRQMTDNEIGEKIRNTASELNSLILMATEANKLRVEMDCHRFGSLQGTTQRLFVNVYKPL